MVYNKNKENNGTIISMRKQSGIWIASITNNSIDYWYEKPLHYSIKRKADVVEWAKGYVVEYQFELRF